LHSLPSRSSLRPTKVEEAFMDDKAKLQRTAGMSYATHGGDRVSVRDLLRRKMVQKELARRGHPAANPVPLCRQQAGVEAKAQVGSVDLVMVAKASLRASERPFRVSGSGRMQY